MLLRLYRSFTIRYAYMTENMNDKILWYSSMKRWWCAEGICKVGKLTSCFQTTENDFLLSNENSHDDHVAIQKTKLVLYT